MIFQIYITFCLIGASYQGMTDAEITAWFIRQVVECSKDHPITMGELQMMQKHIMPDSINGKCLVACVMRKADWIDDKGLFDYKKARSWVETEYSDDPNRLETVTKLHDFCRKVNDEPVTDGEKGCDRSYYLAKCFIDNGPKMGLKQKSN